MPVTSSVPQRSPASGGWLWSSTMWLVWVGCRGCWVKALLVPWLWPTMVTPLVSRPSLEALPWGSAYPIGVRLKNLGSSFGLDGIFGCHSPPCRHRRGNLLPLLAYIACLLGVQSDIWQLMLLRIVGFVSLAAVDFTVASFVRFCFVFLLIFVKLLY